MELSIHDRFEIDDEGDRDSSKDSEARERARTRALECLRSFTQSPMTDVPPAWVKAAGLSRSGDEMDWDDADPSFEPRLMAGVFSEFPIEAWCVSTVYKPLFERWLIQLVDWTAERLMPSWGAEQPQGRRESRSRVAEMHEWNDVLGDLLARAAPFFDLAFVRGKLLGKFLTDGDEELEVLAEFVTKTVARHVMDTEAVPENTFALLDDCAERVIRDPVFRPGGYRAGEIHGHDLPKLIKALLFVLNDNPAPGSRRFANGDWSQIGMIMPVVGKLVTAVGWSTFVAENFLTLCERADAAYPVDAFVEQTNAVLAGIGNAKGSWSGTLLPARIAATVQRLADANYPLQSGAAQGLLRVLDVLIDLGDRRSAALEQTEAFRNIRRADRKSGSE